MFAHYVFLIAMLLACSAPGTPVPCKTGHTTGLHARAGQQRPGPTTLDPSSGQPPFTLLPVARKTAEPLLLCDPGAGCTHTPRNCDHTPHVLFSPVFRAVSYNFPRVMFYSVPHTHGKSCIPLSTLSTHMHPAVPALLLLCYAF